MAIIVITGNIFCCLFLFLYVSVQFNCKDIVEKSSFIILTSVGYVILSWIRQNATVCQILFSVKGFYFSMHLLLPEKNVSSYIAKVL